MHTQRKTMVICLFLRRLPFVLVTTFPKGDCFKLRVISWPRNLCDIKLRPLSVILGVHAHQKLYSGCSVAQLVHSAAGLLYCRSKFESCHPRAQKGFSYWANRHWRKWREASANREWQLPPNHQDVVLKNDLAMIEYRVARFACLNFK